MKRFFAAFLTFGLFMASTSAASDFSAVSLPAIDHNDASLVVVAPDGTETRYLPADLEALPTYDVTTTTPWREKPATFSGILLADLLQANGLGDVDAILVTAENDYSTTIGRELLDEVRIMVATRVDGRAHTRRERGPIQFIIEQTEFDGSDLTSESDFVWMAARIEAAD